MKRYYINPALIEDFENLKKLVSIFIKSHAETVSLYKKLQDYYGTKHDILKRENDDDSKPNNKLVSNYAKYITDIATGYFLGIPVTYNSKDTAYTEKLNEINKLNDDHDENSEIGKQCSIKGMCYELLFQNENAETRYKYIKPEEAFLVYDNSVDPNVLFGVRYYLESNPITDEDIIKVEVYTTEEIYYFDLIEEKLIERDISEHFFREVPIVEYINNEELTGDFEVVLSLIDAYNNAQSDTANDFEYFSDAYLALVGMSATEQEDIAEMKKNRVLLLDENGQAQWLVKEINDTALENYKDRLQKDISKFSLVPSLTDEDFAGNQSGVSLKYKLWGLEQLTSIKERKFKKGLQRRYKLINNILGIKGNSFDANGLEITFYRNIPANLLEIADMLSKLGNTISQETKLEQIPFVKDVKEEMERVDAEMKKQLQEFQTQNEGDVNAGQKVLGRESPAA